MNPKIMKLREEHRKNKAKISRLQFRNRELETQIRELENTDIVGLVRAQGFSLEDFAALMRDMKAPAVISTPENKEESENDET